jgi:hypothetical protein
LAAAIAEGRNREADPESGHRFRVNVERFRADEKMTPFA